jgi:phosphopantetheine adenylyltransferase/dephospho-CoA kinase
LRVVGLTGGIASGKSTVAGYFRDRNVPVIDADKLGHRAYEPDTDAYRQVIAVFGQDLVAEDGSINRQVLGSKVFGQPDEMKKLTDIVWPAIRRFAEEEIASLGEEGHGVVVLEAAVMFEAGWEDLADEVWVVVVEPDLAVERIAIRNGLDEAAARARIASQLTNDERTSRADVVIENNGSLADLEARFNEEWAGLQERAAAPTGGNA